MITRRKRRNGFDAAKNPILRTLDTIEWRDAVLNVDGTRAESPKADVVVGNPPFLGRGMLIPTLGEGYCIALRKAYGLPDGADLVCYWFDRALEQIKSHKLNLAGFVATNSIRGGSNREVLKKIVAHAPINTAWSDEPWVVDGAAVRVSIVSFGANEQIPTLNGQHVDQIHADLTASAYNLTDAKPLKTNYKSAFQGLIPRGSFVFDRTEIGPVLAAPLNPNGRPNTDVIRPYRNGSDLVRRPEDRWLVDFGEMTSGEAALYEQPFQMIEPVRAARAGARLEGDIYEFTA